tara:strand:+ start:96 stop:398 length:303 start_codon:yes stop_codon:yes gene_type:complete
MDKIKSEVSETKTCYIFEPLNPAVKGHLLVVNKIHTKDFTDEPDVFAETARVAGWVANQLGGDFNLITSKGHNATQTVFHCHIHLVPRKENDNLKLPWSL